MKLIFFISSFLLLCALIGAPTLPSEEVETLQSIGKTLMKKWNFSVDPCDDGVSGSGWRNLTTPEGSEDAVTCDCSFLNGTVCHVTSILIKTQNLQGSLPKELVKLAFLQELNLARNYLSGSIPQEWGSLSLRMLTLSGNRLSGPIPKEIANITTLERLILENNEFSGTLPPELGNLKNLQRLFLSSNRFKGKIPSSFSKMINMRSFRISDNEFRETIPDFIEKWTELEILVLHSSGLSGPIPLSIGGLTKLKELRVSDMAGPESPFPPLRRMQKLRILILRNLNLTGELPSYLGTNTSNLTLLDVSFNKLSGPIPIMYEELRDVEHIYFTGNMLNGSVPSWMPKERDGDIIDLTYNKFSQDLTTKKCVAENLDLFAASYSLKNNSLNVFCLKDYQCPKLFSSLHINCGGDEVVVNGTTYEADKYDKRPMFYESALKGWVMSNTGHFLEDYRSPRGSTIWWDSSKLTRATDRRLYGNARLSALSLTYLAICLQDGSYKINLHFAEIVFSGGRTYTSLGKRYFNIYIQEQLVLKDFNIANEAGGIGMPIVKTFPIVISEGKLQIRLSWAGRGTVSIPDKGVYGPLISAISIVRDFDSNSRSKKTISIGEAVGIAIGVTLFLLILILVILWFGGCLCSKSQIERDFKRLDYNINAFSLRQIKEATNDFSDSNKIGQGGFGPVYRGLMSDGRAIAVKQLSEKSSQGNREFLNEIGMISALQHPAVVKLYGCCVEGGQLLLVYEYVENNSLARALFGPQETQVTLDWPTRQKICIGIARGLAHIHQESRLKIVHRDIKAANILLDKDLNPKISDFGLAKLYSEDQSHVTTRAFGTFGYIAPEYAFKGHLSDKSDVYSFGVVVMEVLCGKSNSTARPESEDVYFVDWVRLMWKQNKLLEFIDPRLQTYNKDEFLVTIKVALLCTSRLPTDRPPMSVVLDMLEGQLIEEVDKNLEKTMEHGYGDDDEKPDLLQILAEIDSEVSSEEKSPVLLPGKGKEKILSDSDSFKAESSAAGAERERR